MFFFAAFVAGSFSVGALVADKVGPAAFNALRFTIGSIIVGMVASLALQERMRWIPTAPWRYLLLGSLMAAFMVTMFFALQFTEPVSTSAVFMLVPLMTAFFGYVFLGQKPQPLVLACLLVAGAGALWVVFRGDLDALLSFDIGKGEAIFLFGCACHAAYAPLVRKLNRGEPVLTFTFFTLVATALCLGFLGMREILDTEWHKLPVFIWIAIGYLTLFTTAGSFFLLQFASMKLPASKVFAYAYLIPAFVILYEGLAGHGWASPSVAVGAGITVAALAVLVLAPDPR
ncbi:MAG: DMT family transporter [Rhizobiaceae bacterium]|nr:DMT family transporter [Rhizobiaceae bacterium]